MFSKYLYLVFASSYLKLNSSFTNHQSAECGSLVVSIFGSIRDIAFGNLKKAVAYVEKVLATGLTLVISFMARYVGLGGIGKEIQKILKAIREPVDKAINRVISWLVRKAKALWKKGKAAVKKGINIILKLLRIKKKIKSKKGKTHTLFMSFMRKIGGKLKVSIKSKVQSYEDFVNDLEKSIPTQGNQTEIDKMKKAIPLARDIAPITSLANGDHKNLVENKLREELKDTKDEILEYEVVADYTTKQRATGQDVLDGIKNMPKSLEKEQLSDLIEAEQKIPAKLTCTAKIYDKNSSKPWTDPTAWKVLVPTIDIFNHGEYNSQFIDNQKFKDYSLEKKSKYIPVLINDKLGMLQNDVPKDVAIAIIKAVEDAAVEKPPVCIHSLDQLKKRISDKQIYEIAEQAFIDKKIKLMERKDKPLTLGYERYSSPYFKNLSKEQVIQMILEHQHSLAQPYLMFEVTIIYPDNKTAKTNMATLIDKWKIAK